MDLRKKLERLKQHQAEIEAAIEREAASCNAAVVAALAQAIEQHPEIAADLACAELPARQAAALNAWIAAHTPSSSNTYPDTSTAS